MKNLLFSIIILIAVMFLNGCSGNQSQSINGNSIKINSNQTTRDSEKLIYQDETFVFNVDKNLINQNQLQPQQDTELLFSLKQKQPREYCNSDNSKKTADYLANIATEESLTTFTFNLEQNISLRITITNNYFSWTTEEAEKRLTICGVGADYPVKADKRHILWFSSCAGGKIPEGVNEDSYLQAEDRCNLIKQQVIDSFVSF